MNLQILEVKYRIQLRLLHQLQEHRHKLAPKLLGIIQQFGLPHRINHRIQQYIQPYRLELP